MPPLLPPLVSAAAAGLAARLWFSSWPLALSCALSAALLARLFQIKRSIDAITTVAERLAGGDYAAHAVVAPAPEHERLAQALDRLAGDIEGTIAKLARDKAQLTSILENAVEAFAAVSPEGRLIAVNPALCRLFGVDTAACLERPMIERLRHARLNELVTDVLAGGAASVEEVALFTPEERVFEAHAVPLMEKSRRAGALLILHDITRLRRLEQVRRDFVANVSHELRTPLASIKGFAETLREGALEDKKRRLEFVEAIEKDTERLAALVEDLLDLSAIESGQRKPDKKPVDALALARETVLSLKPHADKRRVKIAVKDAPGLPLVAADLVQLKQVLANLLDNAIKYNREGGSVTVAAEVREGFLRISVKDTGQGIPPEDLPRVFERFYRVDKARDREHGGTGLGLSIVKHIVEAHGGEVCAESRPGEGSAFHVSLPL